MKKGLLILLMGILFILTGCDNNKGPFQVKNENGIKVLYSGKKPAKGWVEQNIYNYNGESTKVYEIYFEDGLPAGDFRLFDTKGNLVVDAEGKWKDGLFKGKIKEKNNNGSAKGTFSINTDFLINFEGEGYYNFSYVTLTDGKFDSDAYKFSKKDGKYDGKYIQYNGSGEVIGEWTYKNGEYDGEYMAIGGSSSAKIIRKGVYKNGEFTGKESYYFYSDGKLYKEEIYENGERIEIKKY